jgi:hypothetical protein
MLLKTGQYHATAEGDDMQRLLLPLLLLTCLPLSAHAANPVICGTTGTADAIINAATATALASGGGTVDCRSLIGNQTVAANITLNAPNTKYIFSDGVTFVPNAANLFINGTVDGVEIECGGAGGTVFEHHKQNGSGAHAGQQCQRAWGSGSGCGHPQQRGQE